MPLQVMPFQKDAMAFAGWCNTAPPRTVSSLLGGKRDFVSFADRWKYLQAGMAAAPAPSAPDATAAATAAAANATAAATVNVDGDVHAEVEGAQAGPSSSNTAQGGRLAGGRQAGAGCSQPQEYVRVFSEEYKPRGRAEYTRHFIAATYPVCARMDSCPAVGCINVGA